MIFKFSASEADKAFEKIRGYIKPRNSYTIEVVRSKGKRSIPQNRYYWGVIITIISESTGYTMDEMHQELARMFLVYEKEGKKFTRSTAGLDSFEAEKYYEQCRHWAWHELNLHIPLPNELTEEVLMHLKNTYSY